MATIELLKQKTSMPNTTVKRIETVTIPIAPEELIIGEPIPWSVFDEDQHLLLRKGFIISSQRQLDTLFKRGIRRLTFESDTDIKENFVANNKFHIFELKEILLERLGNAYKLFESDQQQFFPFCIGKLALDIQAICLDNLDSILAALHLDIDGDYKLNRPLHTAVLCEMLAKRLGVSQMHRLSLVAAALCHDLCSYGEQAELEITQGPLSKTQWAHVKGHPERAYKALIKAGVTDDVWLNTVLHHHERNDGKGYPHELTRHQLHLTTRILMICDVYTAMVRKRPYRDPLKSKYAIKELLRSAPIHLDPDLSKMFIDEIGLYPPGTILKLKTGEVAIVIGRGSTPEEPQIMTISDGGSSSYPLPVKANAREAGIFGIMPAKVISSLAVDLSKLWPLMQPISVS